VNRADYLTAGRHLREIRESLGLTLKNVEEQSRRIVEIQQDSYYLITAGRLSQIENSNSLPSLYKLATLSFIYKLPLTAMFRIYGVEIQGAEPEQEMVSKEDPVPSPI
jgi:transcriptional regulator with XRE-family HTH domain